MSNPNDPFTRHLSSQRTTSGTLKAHPILDIRACLSSDTQHPKLLTPNTTPSRTDPSLPDTQNKTGLSIPPEADQARTWPANHKPLRHKTTLYASTRLQRRLVVCWCSARPSPGCSAKRYKLGKMGGFVDYMEALLALCC